MDALKFSLLRASVARAAQRGVGWVLAVLFLMSLGVPVSGAATTVESVPEAPLVIGHRTIHVFRGSLDAFTPAERAEGARQRILKAFDAPGAGWTSVKSADHGVLVQLDGKPMFTVVAGDVQKLTDETPETLANHASRMLQTAWSESRERSDPRATWAAVLKVLFAVAILLAVLFVVWKVSRYLRDAVTVRLANRLEEIPHAGLGSKLASLFLTISSRSCVLFAWALSLLAVFVFLAYSLDQFAHTRAMGEGLLHSFSALLLQIVSAVAAALPGMFIAVLIFLVAWVATQVSAELFNHVARGQLKLGMLDAHTAPATRRIANAMLWLFALAMAYPYLPGAQTEAFKGLSVILGLMVSIGASGVIGQIAGGVILVYTRALSLGEYVRIQDCEGTVTEIGLFVTRLRTGLGEEIALPNALVVGNVTRNFSRLTAGTGFVLDTAVTIGYDTPWRQVHAMLLEATKPIAEIAAEPAPYVVQTALSDFYVAYRLVVYVGTEKPAVRARVTSDLYASIQDVFNKYGVQIMSPGYYDDPAAPKIVPEANWYLPPASRPPTDRADTKS
ncbi:MAG: mechanosensitive ion channel domain-containing protein [Usitatibacteraceae bacterium]